VLLLFPLFLIKSIIKAPPNPVHRRTRVTVSKQRSINDNVKVMPSHGGGIFLLICFAFRTRISFGDDRGNVRLYYYTRPTPKFKKIPMVWVFWQVLHAVFLSSGLRKWLYNIVDVCFSFSAATASFFAPVFTTTQINPRLHSNAAASAQRVTAVSHTYNMELVIRITRPEHVESPAAGIVSARI
jgi:hypothetical protein